MWSMGVDGASWVGEMAMLFVICVRSLVFECEKIFDGRIYALSQAPKIVFPP